MTHPTFVSDLAIVLGVAAVMSILMRLLRQSTVVGYLLAGLVVGPYIPVPLFAEPERVHSMAEFGVVLVMFAIGLEFRIRKFVDVLPVSGLTGLLQMSFLFWCGLTVGGILGWSSMEALFLGAAISISSTMVVSKVFDQQKGGEGVREFIFGILVIQDLAAVVLIAVVTGIASGQGLAAAALFAALTRLAVVLLGLVVVGLFIVPRVVRLAHRFGSAETLVVVVTGACFVTAVLAQEMGYSVALGAFVAGVLVAESGQERAIGHLVRPLRDVFAAIFFVSIGMTVDPVMALGVLPEALLVVGTIIIGQFVSVSFSGVLSGNGLRRSVCAGLALGQIGEFAFIIGGVGLAAGLVRPELQSILVTVAVLTAFTTPLFFGRADRLFAWVERLLPARVIQSLKLYESWFETWRSGAASGTAMPSMRRAARVIVLDLLVLIGLAVAAEVAGPEAAAAMVRLVALPEAAGGAAVVGIWLLVAAPFVVGLVKNTSALAGLVSRAVIASPAAGARPAAPLLQRTYRIIIYVAVILAVGFPICLVLQPVTGATPLVLLVVGTVLASGFFVWSSTGDVDPRLRSGAERVARLLARQAAQEELAEPHGTARLPGFDLVFAMAIPADSDAVGKTLTELNLRALTGATVVAIRRGNEDVLLPTGREALMAGDVLGLAGKEEAIRKANVLLRQGSHRLGSGPES